MTKKTLALTALAAALSAPGAMAADWTVYGRAHLSLDSVDNGAATDNGNMHIASNSSRLGFRASTDVNGMKAMAQVESGVSWGTNDTAALAASRDSFIGLSGGFGSVKIGRLAWANQYVYDANFFGDQVGDAGIVNENGTPGGRRNNQIQYETPNMSGFTARLSFVPEDDNADAAESDLGIRLAYSANNIFAAFTQLTTGSDSAADENETQAIALGYDFGMGKVALMMVQGENAGVDKPDVMTVGASFNAGTGTFKVQYSTVDGVAANADGTLMAVGYDHPLTKEVSVYFAYAKADNDPGSAVSVTGYGHDNTVGAVAAGDDPSAISVGLIVSFM